MTEMWLENLTISITFFLFSVTIGAIVAVVSELTRGRRSFETPAPTIDFK